VFLGLGNTVIDPIEAIGKMLLDIQDRILVE
jgi:hypothetical protein